MRPSAPTRKFREAPVGALGAGGAPARDEHAVGVGQVLVDGAVCATCSPACPVNRSAVALPCPVRAASVRQPPHLRADPARTVAHLRRLAAGQRPCLVRLARQRVGGVIGQADVGPIAHVGIDDGRVDPCRADSEALLPRRAGRGRDHAPADLLDDLGPQAPRELADRRLIRHPLAERQQTEPSQVQRVRHLPHERLITPARAVLDDHQAHEPVDRHGRAPEHAATGQLSA